MDRDDAAPQQKTPEPTRKLVPMSRFGLAAASRIYGPEKALAMFHKRCVPLDGEILAVAPEDTSDGR